MNSTSIQRSNQPFSGLKVLLSTLLGVIHLTGILPATAVEGQESNPISDSPEPCYQIAAPEKDSWLTSGGWTPSGQLLLVDVLSRQIHRLTRASHPVPTLFSEIVKVRDFSTLERPTELRSLPDGGFYVEDEKQSRGSIDKLVRFDASLTRVGEVKIKNRPLQSGGTIQVLYDWTPWGDGFFAYADILEDGAWTSSFLYFDEDGNDQVFLTLATRSETSYQHTKENHYLAVVGDVGYILLYEPEPQLISVQLDTRESFAQEKSYRTLEPLPQSFRRRPLVTENPSFLAASGKIFLQLTVYFEQLEQTAAALEIHSWNDRLFLLGKTAAKRTKSFSASGSKKTVEFSLVELDPGSGEELGRMPLPVGPGVGHLTVVPGPNHWALIGRENVQGIGPGSWNAPFMRHQGPTFIPAHWLDDLDPESLAVGAAQAVDCRSLEK